VGPFLWIAASVAIGRIKRIGMNATKVREKGKRTTNILSAQFTRR
jgi:hypothetical protein